MTDRQRGTAKQGGAAKQRGMARQDGTAREAGTAKQGGTAREAGTAKQGGTARELALDILLEILERGAWCHVALGQALGKYQYLQKQDRAFITRVVEGTLEYRIQIDFILNQFVSTGLERQKPLIRTLLRMSAYQILYMDRVPDSAVCNEAVKLAEKRRFGGLKGVVNGVLRNVSRKKGDFVFSDDSTRYSMPQWIIDMWKEAFGEQDTSMMLQALLGQPPLSVRCSLERASREEIADSLRRQGVSVADSSYADDMLTLEHVDYLEALDTFQKGLITVQDLSSACVAKAAGIRRGDLILDVCGAPGGKTLHAASLLRLAGGGHVASRSLDSASRSLDSANHSLDSASRSLDSASRSLDSANRSPDSVRRMPLAENGDGGHVIARDISERKVLMIRENLARCGYEDIVTAQVWDALEYDGEMEESADIVLADLPCSGLGVIGRKPDIKGRVKPEDIGELAQLQRQILSVVWRYVKPQGTLVYSTCTLSPRENQENMAWFLENFPFEPVDITGRLGEKMEADTMRQGYLQLLPGQLPCDGFFLAVMRRRGEQGEA